MISQYVANGTKVWHESYGEGEIISQSPYNLNFYNVRFERFTQLVYRGKLTEMEDE